MNRYFYKTFLKTVKLSASQKHLYLIALLPSLKVLEEIRILKEEIKTEFFVSHALNLPAHITLQRPFWVPDEKEEELLDHLSKFSLSQLPFSVELQDFDAFPPRVIFVKILDHLPLIQLQNELQQYIPVAIFDSPGQQQKEIHPHITLATRDLPKEVFPEVWELFKTRKYHNSFIVDSLRLFKHDGKKWHLFRTFNFRSSN